MRHACGLHPLSAVRRWWSATWACQIDTSISGGNIDAKVYAQILSRIVPA
jgi:hypothetical protein